MSEWSLAAELRMDEWDMPTALRAVEDLGLSTAGKLVAQCAVLLENHWQQHGLDPVETLWEMAQQTGAVACRYRDDELVCVLDRGHEGPHSEDVR